MTDGLRAVRVTMNCSGPVGRNLSTTGHLTATAMTTAALRERGDRTHLQHRDQSNVRFHLGLQKDIQRTEEVRAITRPGIGDCARCEFWCVPAPAEPRRRVSRHRANPWQAGRFDARRQSRERCAEIRKAAVNRAPGVVASGG
jgi:hypothetical protein